MRLTKRVKIDNKEYTVKELTVQEVLEIAGSATSTTRTVGGMQDLIKEHLPKATDVTLEDLKMMAPSEIKLLWDAFREVNAVFFGTADSIGVTMMLSDLKSSFMKEWSLLVRTSLKQDMAKS